MLLNQREQNVCSLRALYLFAQVDSSVFDAIEDKKRQRERRIRELQEEQEKAPRLEHDHPHVPTSEYGAPPPSMADIITPRKVDATFASQTPRNPDPHSFENIITAKPPEQSALLSLAKQQAQLQQNAGAQQESRAAELQAHAEALKHVSYLNPKALANIGACAPQEQSLLACLRTTDKNRPQSPTCREQLKAFEHCMSHQGVRKNV
jgi:hypothetical protein